MNYADAPIFWLALNCPGPCPTTSLKVGPLVAEDCLLWSGDLDAHFVCQLCDVEFVGLTDSSRPLCIGLDYA